MNPSSGVGTVQITRLSVSPAGPLTHSLHVKFKVDDTDAGAVFLDKKAKSLEQLLERPLDLHHGSFLTVNIREKHRVRDKTFPAVSLTSRELLHEHEQADADVHLNLYEIRPKGFKRRIWLKFQLPSSIQNGESQSPQAIEEEDVLHGTKQTGDPLRVEIDEAIAKLNDFGTILDRLSWGQYLLDTGLKFGAAASQLNPIAGAVVGCLNVAYDKIKDQNKSHEKVLRLARSMARTVDHVRTVEKISKLKQLKKTLDEFPGLMKETVELIKKLVGQGQFVNLVLTSRNNEKIDELQDRHATFMDEFDRGINVDEAVKVDYLTDEGETKELEKYLAKGITTVEPVAVECIKGTRKEILVDIATKTDDPDGPNVVWIHGAPGSGKSSISLSTKSRLKREKRLVTYFRFDRAQAFTTTTLALWQHVALSLARKFPSLHSQLLEQARDDKVNLDSPVDVFECLVRQPLSGMTEPSSGGPLVIIVDGLDECGGFVGRSSPDRQALLQTLEQWSELPKNMPVKLLVTSREEGDIHELLSRLSMSASIHIPSGSTLVDDPTSKASIGATEDILEFLQYRFKQTAKRLTLGQDWPGNMRITGMTQHAAGNFMWAVTATNFVDSNLDPNKGLELILGSTSESGGMKQLYSLYSTILETSFGTISEEDTEIVRLVLGIMVYAERPLSDDEYSKLPTPTPINRIVLQSIRDGLASVIVLDSDLRFVHKSFDDFLLSAQCPQQFRVAIGEEKIQRLLARLCISTMTSDSGLHFNMCNLETSYLRNVDVEGIESRVKAGISRLLSYSCRFWAVHLSRIPFDDELMQEVAKMFRDKLLYWFEAMSLLKEMNRVSSALLVVLGWSTSSPDKDFKAFIRDAGQFVSAFVYPITQSAPHIYISALPFAPAHSLISKHFLPRFPRTLTLSAGKQINWSSCLFTSEHHKGSVTSLAFSPDEKSFISASFDHTLCVCDSGTGNLISEPFRGGDFICGAFFSPDGRRVWASHDDGQVICWDIGKGNKYLTFTAGNRGAYSCNYFDGGPNIVTVSHEQGTVILWDTATGARLQELFEVPAEIDCYQGWEHKASFSSDGCYLAWARGGDIAIKFWDLVNGREVENRFGVQGHTKAISALSFAVDDLHVVSGSRDGVIVIWDVKTAEPVGRPLVISGGGCISAIAYSHVKRLIVSASGFPGTLMIWNASTCEAILGPLEGHTLGINVITMSRDGRRVLSGSSDGTVRMWDLGWEGTSHTSRAANNGSTNLGGEDVAFTPCGQKLTSIGRDKILRVWDAATCQELHHCIDTGPISSLDAKVIFSPDDKQVIAYDGRILEVWDIDTGESVFRQILTDGEPEDPRWPHLAFRWTDHRIITCSRLGIIRAWCLEDGTVTEDVSISSPIPSDVDWGVEIHAISPDGLTVFVCDANRTPRYYLWNTTRCQPLSLTFPDEYVQASTFSPSGLLVIASTTLSIWNIHAGEIVTSCMEGDSIWCLAFSSDGHHVAYFQGGSVLISNLYTGHLETLWNSHTQYMRVLSFSPDGNKLVSVAGDGQIRIWDITDLVEGWESLGFLGTGEHMRGGWFLDNQDRLLFWVPNDHRGGLKWPRNTAVLGGTGIPTELNFTDFRYGMEWTECFDTQLM